MKTILFQNHRVETMIPKIKSWGFLPEEAVLTLTQARVRKHAYTAFARLNHSKLRARIVRETHQVVS